MTVNSQLASQHAGLVYFIKMEFTTGTVYATSWSHSIDWDGHTWTGYGAVVDVGGMSQTERLEYPNLDIGLNLADPSMLALALGQAYTYRRQPITTWLGVLDDDLQLILDPLPHWAGVMDQVRLSTGDGADSSAGVVMRCENPSRDTRAQQNLRLNNAQQQARWPGDTGLSRIEQLLSQPTPWLSKRFQHID